MKKLLVAIIVLTTLSIASCKKDELASLSIKSQTVADQKDNGTWDVVSDQKDNGTWDVE